MHGNRIGRWAIVLGATALLAGCQDGAKFPLFQKSAGAETAPAATKLIERDVEAPEVFQTTETGLWDGRPSLGGVWVAYPDVTDPERVIIRNTANGKFVIGALFRRERENPGPKFQVSSDAAAALGLLAGQPTELNVTALRREEVPETPAPVASETLSAPEAIEAEPLAAAAAAIDKAEAAQTATQRPSPRPSATPAPPKATATPVAAATPKASALAKPFIQIGIFSIEANANSASTALRKAGIVPTVLAQESAGKKFWRVVVGPARTTSERSALHAKVKSLGYGDSYFVTN
ncbi:MAG: SPOR domain-containing protein [Rhodobacteraceae bacterium]|nr:SPOR domain-containing protein [Paracoccaceae bacterium]